MSKPSCWPMLKPPSLGPLISLKGCIGFSASRQHTPVLGIVNFMRVFPSCTNACYPQRHMTCAIRSVHVYITSTCTGKWHTMGYYVMHVYSIHVHVRQHHAHAVILCTSHACAHRTCVCVCIWWRPRSSTLHSVRVVFSVRCDVTMRHKWYLLLLDDVSEGVFGAPC